MGFFKVKSKADLQVKDKDHPAVKTAYERVLKLAKDIGMTPGLEAVAEWQLKVIEYNVPHGKLFRTVQIMQTAELLSPRKLTYEELVRVAVLGWILEILHANILLLDDIVDKSETRRGRICWYLASEIPGLAGGDAMLLAMFSFHALTYFFKDHPQYDEMLHLMMDVHYKTAMGQTLDTLTEIDRVYNEERFKTLAQYKTAFYAQALPIRMGLYLAGVTSLSHHKAVEEFASILGHFYQVQNDIQDLYCEFSKFRKDGTDIVNGQMTFPLLRVLTIGTEKQKEIVLNNIGKGKIGGPEEAAVKKVYEDLEMRQQFEEEEERAFDNMRGHIKLTEKLGMNGDIFRLLANKVYRFDTIDAADK